jgi:hypothetical protein
MSQSGGLLLDAMGMRHTGVRQNSLQKTFAEMGLTRSWQIYSLKSNEKLCALLVVNHSYLGFNLSELLNGIKVLVANSKALPWNVLSTAISQLAGEFEMEAMAAGALRVLTGQEQPKTYSGVPVWNGFER